MPVVHLDGEFLDVLIRFVFIDEYDFVDVVPRVFLLVEDRGVDAGLAQVGSQRSLQALPDPVEVVDLVALGALDHVLAQNLGGVEPERALPDGLDLDQPSTNLAIFVTVDQVALEAVDRHLAVLQYSTVTLALRVVALSGRGCPPLVPTV